VTHLRKMMLEELQRRNYSQTTARAYLLAVRQFAEYFHRPPDQLGPDHIRRFQSYLLQEKKLSPRSTHTRIKKFIPESGRIKVMTLATENTAYTPPQVSAITGLPLPAVHKAIENRLIRPTRVRGRRGARRLLSKSDLLYLRLEAQGLKLLPLAIRRQVARKIERDSGIDAMKLSEGGVILVQCKSARNEVNAALRRFDEASRMAQSDSDIMHGTPVYKGTRIPVQSIADMLSQGATVADILEGYPALTRRKVELAPLYIKAFPRRGRPAIRPWAKRPPRRVSRKRLTG